MKRSARRELIVAIMALFLVTTIFPVIPIPAAAVDVPNNMGEWTVTGDETYDGGLGTVTGNITVASGGKLTLNNLTIMMRGASPDDLRIRVQQNGILFVHNSVVKAFDPYTPYLFEFGPGSTGLITGSTISNVGSPASATGIEVQGTASVVVRESTIRDSFHGVVALASAPTIKNCTIRDGQGFGVLALEDANVDVTDTVITGFTQGVGILLEGSRGELKANTISNNKAGIEMTSSHAVIDTNAIRYNFMNGMRVDASTANLRDTEINDNGDDGIDASASTVVADRTIIDANGASGILSSASTFTIRDSEISGSGTKDIVLIGTPTTERNVVTLVNTSFGSYSFEDTNPDSFIEVDWYINFKATFESDGGPAEDVGIWLQDASGTVTELGTTGPDGTFGPSDVLSYMVDMGGVVSNTPHTLTVKRGGETKAFVLDLTDAGADVEWAFDDVAPWIGSLEYKGVTKEAKTEVNGSVAQDTVQVSLNGAQAPLTGQIFNGMVDLAPGRNEVVIEAVDEVGNVNDVTIVIHRDVVPPMLVITSPTSEEGVPIYTNLGFITIEGQTEPDIKNLTIANHEVFPDTAGKFTVDVELEVGENYVNVMARDRADNLAIRTLVIFYNPEAPSLSIDQPNAKYTNKGTIQVSGTVDDPDATVTISVNGQDHKVGLSGTRFTLNVDLKEGTNQITVTAVDQAGNAVFVTRSIILDTIAPQLVLDSPSDGLVTSAGTILVEGMTDDDALLTVNDQGAYRDGLDFYTTLSLEEGLNVIDVVARDVAGNSRTLRVTVVRDSVQPSIVIISPEDGLRTAGQKVQIEGYITEDAGLMMNGHAVFVSESEFELTADLREGQNTFWFEARDSAGNLGTATISIVRDSVVILEVYSVEHSSKDRYIVKGRTDADASLTIDGRSYSVGSTGFFVVEAIVKEGTDFTIEVKDPMGNSNSLVLSAARPQRPVATFDWGPVFMWGTLASVMLVVGLVGGTERGRLFALFFLFVPLYSKMKKNTVLDHYTRGQIHGYIVANPGDHYNSIKEALKLNNGTLAYHLRVLEREGVIKSRTDGIYKRFYPMGMKVPETDRTRLTEIQKIIIKRIKETPGISQKEMSRLVGVSPSTINYHIGILKSAGLVRSERRGMRVGYFLEKLENLTAGRKAEEGEGEGEGKVKARTKGQ